LLEKPSFSGKSFFQAKEERGKKPNALPCREQTVAGPTMPHSQGGGGGGGHPRAKEEGGDPFVEKQGPVVKKLLALAKKKAKGLGELGIKPRRGKTQKPLRRVPFRETATKERELVRGNCFFQKVEKRG